MADRQALEPDRPCLGGCGQLLFAGTLDAAVGLCPACWNRVRSADGRTLSDTLRSASSSASLEGARWRRWALVALAVEAAAELESREKRIKRMVPVVRAASEVYEIMRDEGDFAGLRDRLAALEPGDFDAS